MIEILTTFIGLLTGPQLVTLQVTEPVARVEVRVNDLVLADLIEPPWAFRLNLGDSLQIVDLEVIGFDDFGEEVDRTQRWINVQMPEGVTEQQAAPVVVYLSNAEMDLPHREEMQSWFLEGEARVALAAEAANGGEIWSKPPAEVVVVMDPQARHWLRQMVELFPDSYFAGTLDKRLELLRFNMDMSQVQKPLSEFLDIHNDQIKQSLDLVEAKVDLEAFWRSYRDFTALAPDARVRWVSPRGAGDSSTAMERSLLTQVQGGPGLGLVRLHHTARKRNFPLRFADAVATAGLELHTSGQRRALLLIRAGEVEDGSRLKPEGVRKYLEAIGVPLMVWDVRPKLPAGGWGSTRMVGFPKPETDELVTFEMAKASFEALDEATQDLRGILDRQRVVWLERPVVPGRLSLAAGALGLDLLPKWPERLVEEAQP